ncbi:MAG TPA: 30S ribosome-binding factor RbfA, partial [Gammaproteobacteria bacterium]|nr:30S ribosome-binding factor RbfA [Gammaproteobacteria bacterium]
MTARAQRIADQIQREIAVLIQLEVSDPRVGMVSVTGVDVSNDLAYAKIYITVLNSLAGDEQINADTLSEPGVLDQLEIEENLKALKKASGFLRTLLAKRLRLRVVP